MFPKRYAAQRWRWRSCYIHNKASYYSYNRQEGMARILRRMYMQKILFRRVLYAMQSHTKIHCNTSHHTPTHYSALSILLQFEIGLLECAILTLPACNVETGIATIHIIQKLFVQLSTVKTSNAKSTCSLTQYTTHTCI